VSPAFGPPRVPPSTGDERELLLRFLRWKREHVAATSDGLDDEQARWTPGDRLLPILGIIHHLTLMEWRWIEGRYLGTPFPPREPDEQHPGPELTLASALTAYAARAERTEEVVRAAPSLDVPCLGVEDERGAACGGCCCTSSRTPPTTPATPTAPGSCSTAAARPADVDRPGACNHPIGAWSRPRRRPTMRAAAPTTADKGGPCPIE
jgi:hypothetical protein